MLSITKSESRIQNQQTDQAKLFVEGELVKDVKGKGKNRQYEHFLLGLILLEKSQRRPNHHEPVTRIREWDENLGCVLVLEGDE